MICDAKSQLELQESWEAKFHDNRQCKDDAFEAAAFDGTNIRLMQKRLASRTDAAAKFEKGLCPDNAIDGLTAHALVC